MYMHTHTHTSLMLDITIRYTVIIFLVSRGLGTLVAIGLGVHRPHISVHQCFFGLQKRAHHIATLIPPCGHNITWQPSHPMWPAHHMATLTPHVASTPHGNPHTLCGHNITWQPSHPMWPKHHTFAAGLGASPPLGLVCLALLEAWRDPCDQVSLHQVMPLHY